MTLFTVLGAERPAAISAAYAHPEHTFVFVSREADVDGQDLGNVSFARELRDMSVLNPERTIVLDPSWLGPPSRRLSRDLLRLHERLGEWVLPTTWTPHDRSAEHIIKGDSMPTPDERLVGSVDYLELVARSRGLTDVLYQPLIAAKRRMIVTGRHVGNNTTLAVILVHVEIHARFAFLITAEVIEEPLIASRSLDAVRVLQHEGFFTLNWVETQDGAVLTSFRPWPAPAFGAFVAASASLLEPRTGTCVLPAGYKWTCRPNFAPTERRT